MNILALETSSPVLSIAVRKGKTGKVFSSSLSGFSKHAENLLPTMDRLLKKAGLSINKIDAYLIGRGPGSFTGLRISFSALKGFLSLEKRDCFGAVSLDLIAENIKAPEGTRLGVCLDAYRRKVYVQFIRRRINSLALETKPAALLLEEFLAQLSPETVLTGNAIERYREEIIKKFPKIHFSEEKLWYPTASSLISLFQAGDPKIVKLTAPEDFIPMYFRLSEAEEKLKEHVHAG